MTANIWNDTVLSGIARAGEIREQQKDTLFTLTSDAAFDAYGKLCTELHIQSRVSRILRLLETSGSGIPAPESIGHEFQKDGMVIPFYPLEHPDLHLPYGIRDKEQFCRLLRESSISLDGITAVTQYMEYLAGRFPAEEALFYQRFAVASEEHIRLGPYPQKDPQEQNAGHAYLAYRMLVRSLEKQVPYILDAVPLLKNAGLSDAFTLAGYWGYARSWECPNGLTDFQITDGSHDPYGPALMLEEDLTLSSRFQKEWFSFSMFMDEPQDFSTLTLSMPYTLRYEDFLHPGKFLSSDDLDLISWMDEDVVLSSLPQRLDGLREHFEACAQKLLACVERVVTPTLSLEAMGHGLQEPAECQTEERQEQYDR